MSKTHSLALASSLSIIISLFGSSGCDLTAIPVDNNVNLQPPEKCGQTLSGLLRSMNGQSLQGMGTNPGTVIRITKGCVEISDLHLENGTIVGTRNGQIMRGADFVGTTVTQQDTENVTSLSVIAAVSVDSRDPTGETLLYSLKTSGASGGELVDVCAPDASGMRAAVAVPGTWNARGAHTANTTRFTLGCTSAAIGKCVQLGYRPWAKKGSTSLESYHQACTRMIRSDYCGDGTAHTVDGTDVDVYDLLGINVRDPSVLSPFDAAWSEDGAYCIERQRWTRLSTTGGASTQTILPNDCLNQFEAAVVESSPVDALDVCSVRNKYMQRSAVKLDNRSGINVILK